MMHVIVAVIAAFGILWALTIWIVDGFTVALGGVTLQSYDPRRPLAAGLLAAMVYALTGGPVNAAT